MHAAVTTSDHRLVISEVGRPAPGPGQLLLAVEASGICGSDLHALDALGAGLTPGHEFIGRVVELGSGTTGFETGDRVASLPVIACKHCRFCLSGDPINCVEARYFGSQGQPGSFAQFLVVDAQASVLVGDSIPLEHAATIEPLSIALKVVERADPKPGDRVLVIGAGPIGLAVTLWLRANGVGTIVVSDPVESRRRLATEMGATHTVDPLTQDLAEVLRRETGDLANIVIECAGRPGTFAQATELVVLEGTVVIAGMHMRTEEFSRLTPFLKNLTVRFCCWYTTRHYEHTIRMLSSGRIDPGPMVTHQISYEQLDDTITQLRTPNEFGKVLLLTPA